MDSEFVSFDRSDKMKIKIFRSAMNILRDISIAEKMEFKLIPFSDSITYLEQGFFLIQPAMPDMFYTPSGERHKIDHCTLEYVREGKEKYLVYNPRPNLIEHIFHGQYIYSIAFRFKLSISEQAKERKQQAIIKAIESGSLKR